MSTWPMLSKAEPRSLGRLDLASSHRAIGSFLRRYHITYAHSLQGRFVVGRHLLDEFT